MGLLLDSKTPAAPGAAIEIEGEEAGYITSSVFSPALDQAIALGYVKWKHREPGASATVAQSPATLRDLPLV